MAVIPVAKNNSNFCQCQSEFCQPAGRLGSISNTTVFDVALDDFQHHVGGFVLKKITTQKNTSPVAEVRLYGNCMM